MDDFGSAGPIELDLVSEFNIEDEFEFEDDYEGESYLDEKEKPAPARVSPRNLSLLNQGPKIMRLRKSNCGNELSGVIDFCPV